MLLVVAAGSGMGATCSGGKTTAPRDLPPLAADREVLGPGDVIEIRIFGEPDLSGVQQLSSGGQLHLPLIGTIDAQGMTLDELSDKITQEYNRKYLRDAEVSLLLREYNSRKIFVIGEVQRPGPYPFERHMTIIAAIAKAGGTTKLADANRTLITRLPVDGSKEPVRVLVEVGQIGKGQSPDVELQPGDIILVPETLF
jgi:polysaccharide export outer membrane protein